jgi:hypothetical protein
MQTLAQWAWNKILVFFASLHFQRKKGEFWSLALTRKERAVTCISHRINIPHSERDETNTCTWVGT